MIQIEIPHDYPADQYDAAYQWCKDNLGVTTWSPEIMRASDCRWCWTVTGFYAVVCFKYDSDATLFALMWCK